MTTPSEEDRALIERAYCWFAHHPTDDRRAGPFDTKEQAKAWVRIRLGYEDWVSVPLFSQDTLISIRAQAAAEAMKLVRSAYNEGFTEGMNEFQTSRGGKPWSDSNSAKKLAAIRSATHRRAGNDRHRRAGD